MAETVYTGGNTITRKEVEEDIPGTGGPVLDPEDQGVVGGGTQLPTSDAEALRDKQGTGTETTTQTPTGGDDLTPAVPATQVPPPPPFIPAPETGGTSAGQQGLADYAADWMSAPSRYDMDVVQQGMNTIRDAMGEVRRKGMQSTEADLARRGLNASTMGQETSDIARAGYDRQEQQQLFNLMREQAMTAGADRGAAFGAGLGAEGLAESSRQFDRGLSEQSRQFGAGLESSERQFGQSLTEQSRQFGEMQAMERDRMNMSDRQFQQNYGLSRDQFDENKRQFDTDSGMRERAMELQQQGFDADEAWRRSQMEFQENQFGFTQSEADKNRRMQFLQMAGGLEGMDSEEFERLARQWGFNDMFGGQSSGGQARPRVPTYGNNNPYSGGDQYGFPNEGDPISDEEQLITNRYDLQSNQNFGF